MLVGKIEIKGIVDETQHTLPVPTCHSGGDYTIAPASRQGSRTEQLFGLNDRLGDVLHFRTLITGALA